MCFIMYLNLVNMQFTRSIAKLTLWMLLFSTFWDFFFHAGWMWFISGSPLSLVSAPSMSTQFCCNSFLIEDNFFGSKCNSGYSQSCLRDLCVCLLWFDKISYWEWICDGTWLTLFVYACKTHLKFELLVQWLPAGSSIRNHSDPSISCCWCTLQRKNYSGLPCLLWWLRKTSLNIYFEYQLLYPSAYSFYYPHDYVHICSNLSYQRWLNQRWSSEISWKIWIERSSTLCQHFGSANANARINHFSYIKTCFSNFFPK